jgi:hypothetical protein
MGMQNQEHLYENNQEAVDTSTLNTDPREQGQPQAEGFRPYTEGYYGSPRRDIWSEGEKLQAEPRDKNRQNISWFLSLAILLCAVFIAGSVFGAIVSWLSWLIVMLLIVAVAFAFILNWRIVSFAMPERRFQITEHARLDLNNAMGKVSIRRGEPGVITVNATKRASGFGINPEQMQVFYDQRGDALGISTKMNWHILQFGLRSIHFEITVPENCDVQLKNGSGRVAIQGTSGDIRLRTGSGGIEASDLQGQIALQTGSGAIQASNLQGQIALKTGSGGIKVHDLQGQMDVLTGSGGIESSGLRGQVVLKTGSGGITMRQSLLAGSSRITTGSGGIVYEGALDPRGDTLIKTGSGGIAFTLPDNSAFSLDAKTGAGKVANSFGGNEVGSGQRARLKLRTGSGGIRIANSEIF